MKQLLLTQEEIQEVVNNLTGTDVSNETLYKLIQVKDREQRDYYKPKKGVISKEMYVVKEIFTYGNPLERIFRTEVVRDVRDHTKTLYKVTDNNRYILTFPKTEVFNQRWVAKIWAYKKHIRLLEERMSKLKTDKGKKPYLDLITTVKRKLHLIEDFPEKYI